MFDITIIGAGITGIFLAESFKGKNLKICLLEVGDINNCNYNMNYQHIGSHEGIKVVSNYNFGGGHNVWHGLLGRLENEEIDEREWGVSPEEFSRNYDIAESYFGLNSKNKNEIKANIDYELDNSPLNSLNRKIFYQPKLSFNKKKRLKELVDGEIDVRLNAKVLEVRKDNEHYQILFDEGLENLNSKIVIIAANPIQSAVILRRSTTVGDESIRPIIGNYLSDHPMGVVGKIELEKNIRFPLTLIRKRFDAVFAKVGFMEGDGKSKLTHTFYLIPTLEKKFNKKGKSLRNSLLAIRETGLNLSIIKEIFRNLSTVLFIISYKTGFMFSTKYLDILVVSEQELSRDNKVECDENGLVKKWTISNNLIDSIGLSIERFASKLRKSGLNFELTMLGKEEIMSELTSAAHLCCTTKMGDVGSGVVDAVGRVHGENGLYVAGASVFPRALSLNTTLTATAIAASIAKSILKEREL